MKGNNIIDFKEYSYKKKEKNELERRANGEIFICESRKKELRFELREKLRNKNKK